MVKAWNRIKIGMLAAGVAMVAVSDLGLRAKKQRLTPTQAELNSVLPGSSVKNKLLKPIPHYPGVVRSGGGTRRAAALVTAELPPRIKGYVDEINLLFALDEDGRILGIKVMSQRETPYYFRLIRNAEFLPRLTGRNASQLAEIKVVSGASVSSKAIIADLQAASNLALKEIFRREVPPAKSAARLQAYFQPRVFALLIVLLLGLAAAFFRGRRFRWLVYGLSLAVIGVWLKTPLSLPHLFQIASLQAPWQSNPGLIILCGFVILTTIFLGPLWCARLCPFAALQDAAFELGKKHRWRLSPGVVRFARELRWVVVFAALVLYFPLRIRSGAEIEPFFHLFAAEWTAAGLALAAVTLLAAAFVPRFWCRFFCPTGAILILLSSHRRFFKRIEQGIRASGIDSSGAGDDRPGA